MNRIKKSGEVRPLLVKADGSQLNKLLARRKRWYRVVADYEVETENKKEEVVKEIKFLTGSKKIFGKYFLKHLEGKTEIMLGKGIFEKIPDLVGKRGFFVVTSKNIFNLYRAQFSRLFSQKEFKGYYPVPDGERFKNAHQALKIIEGMSKSEVKRSDVLLTVGGGVIGDIGGFASSIYMRGINWINVPTTLLAQVDSSIGGKTAVNTAYAKNIIGSFHQPLKVVIDLNFLKTLTVRAFRSGLAEVIKYGIIMDRELFEFLEKKRKDVFSLDQFSLIEIISGSIKNKITVVEEDEKEVSGRRRILNFGHTFGHIFESALGYRKITHGEAVAEGMKISAKICRKMGLIERAQEQRILRLIEDYGFNKEVYVKEVEKFIGLDKKSEGDIIHFIGIEKIGRVKILSIKIKKLIQLYKEVSKDEKN